MKIRDIEQAGATKIIFCKLISNATKVEEIRAIQKLYQRFRPSNHHDVIDLSFPEIFCAPATCNLHFDVNFRNECVCQRVLSKRDKRIGIVIS